MNFTLLALLLFQVAQPSTPPSITLGPSITSNMTTGWTFVAQGATGPLVTCPYHPDDTANSVVHDCKMADGVTLDDLVQFWITDTRRTVTNDEDRYNKLLSITQQLLADDKACHSDLSHLQKIVKDYLNTVGKL